MIPLALGAWAAVVALAPSPGMQALLSAPLVLAPALFWTVFNERRWITIFFFCALLLPPLPFALGDSGPHPALAIAALGLCAGVVRLREWEPGIGGLGFSMAALFLVLFGSAGLAAVYSGLPVALGTLARVTLLGISVYTFFYVTCGPGRYSDLEVRRTTRFIFAVACASALFACIDFYFQFPPPAGYGPQFVWLSSGVFRRAQGIFYEASTLGNFCAFFLVMIFVALFQKGGWLPCSRKLLISGGVIFSAALVFSFSRASLLNVLAALAAFAYLHRVRIRRALWISGSCVATAIAILWYAFPAFAEHYWLRLTAIQEVFGSAESILSGRVDAWRTLWEFIIAHPWDMILGVGYKTLPYSNIVGRPVIADNMYLSLLVETGVVGLVVFAIFNAALLRSARRAALSSDSLTAFFGRWIFCFWVGQLIQMMSGDLLTYWRVLPLYFWVLAIAVRNEHSVPRPV